MQIRGLYIYEGPEMINYDHNDSFKWVSSAFAFCKCVLMDSCLVFCCFFVLSRPVPMPFSALTSGHNVQPYVGSFICSPSAPTWQSISLARQLHYDYGLVLFAYSHLNAFKCQFLCQDCRDCHNETTRRCSRCLNRLLPASLLHSNVALRFSF